MSFFVIVTELAKCSAVHLLREQGPSERRPPDLNSVGDRERYGLKRISDNFQRTRPTSYSLLVQTLLESICHFERRTIRRPGFFEEIRRGRNRRPAHPRSDPERRAPSPRGAQQAGSPSPGKPSARLLSTLLQLGDHGRTISGKPMRENRAECRAAKRTVSVGCRDRSPSQIPLQ